jgi:RecB family endonuclease NucS
MNAVRLVVANCSVEYSAGSARLPPALRLLVFKADGSIAIHAGCQGLQAAELDESPCVVREADGRIECTTPGGEALVIELHEIVHDYSIELGDDPGLAKDGVEAELQELAKRGCAARRLGSCDASTRPTSGRSICCVGTVTTTRSWSR